MSIYKPYKYQHHAQMHIRYNRKCGLFLDMGLGKTVITLTELDWMLNEDMNTKRVLVIAPVRVIKSVWRQEAQKWDHLKHLKFSLVWGNERERLDALRTQADIYLINPEMLTWLISIFQSKWPFDCVVIDELSKFKSATSKRSRAMQIMAPYIKRFIGLTGTPASNGLMDLWSQIFLMDLGERLGKTITSYRDRYFVPVMVEGYTKKYILREHAKEHIFDLIGDICISMQAKDYLELPELIQNDIWIDLEPGAQALYNQFRQDCIMQLGNEEITALSAGSLSNKLLQFSNGAVYHSDKSRDFSVIHNQKLDALEDIVEDSQGASILLFYTYKHDADRIMGRFPNAVLLKSDKDVEDWNAGKIQFLICHPASAGHGLNLQYGGYTMVWFGLNWSLELYQQAVARLLRLGQIHTVIMHRILCRRTYDTRVVKALTDKESDQNTLLEALRAEVEDVRAA